MPWPRPSSWPIRIVVMDRRLDRARTVRRDAIVTDPASDLVRGFVGSEEGFLRLLARLTPWPTAMRAVETAADAVVGREKDESLAGALCAHARSQPPAAFGC